MLNLWSYPEEAGSGQLNAPCLWPRVRMLGRIHSQVIRKILGDEEGGRGGGAGFI